MTQPRRVTLASVIGCCGIVYGDIGTSPLYTMESALGAAGTFNAEALLGVLSLIFWSLLVSVTFKYLTVIMRADNQGEGGILALFALAQRRLIIGSTWARVGATTISLTDPVTIGLFNCAHNGGALNTATFDNVSVTSSLQVIG